MGETSEPHIILYSMVDTACYIDDGGYEWNEISMYVYMYLG